MNSRTFGSPAFANLTIRDTAISIVCSVQAALAGWAEMGAPRLGRRIGDFHQLLSEVFAGKQAEQRFRRVLQTRCHVLLVHEAAISLPAAPRFARLGNAR